MITDGEWKYIWYEEDGLELFFNIQKDSDELNNLSLKKPELMDEWRSKLKYYLDVKMTQLLLITT